MLADQIKPFFWSITYLLSAAAFGLATRPSIWEDYMRVLACAMTLLVFCWTVQSAVLYQRRYRLLPPQRRARMMQPSHIWGMGASYFVLAIPQVERVIGFFGDPIHPTGLPILVVSYGLASYWLWPLVRHQKRMTRKEARVSA